MVWEDGEVLILTSYPIPCAIGLTLVNSFRSHPDHAVVQVMNWISMAMVAVFLGLLPEVSAEETVFRGHD